MRNILIAVGLVLAMSFGAGLDSRADEVRVGLMVHDVEAFSHLGFGGVHGKEQSLSISADYVWEKPDWLAWAFHARPYIGGTINLQGKTSHAGAGVLWRKGFWDKTYGELAFGMVVHDGRVRVPNPIDATTPEEVARRFVLKRSKIEFGSRVLFQTHNSHLDIALMINGTVNLSSSTFRTDKFSAGLKMRVAITSEFV